MLTERTPEEKAAYRLGYESGQRDARARLIRDMLGQLPEGAYTAMLLAAGAIPLERENGGVEYPPFKVFKAMLSAYAKADGISV